MVVPSNVKVRRVESSNRLYSEKQCRREAPLLRLLRQELSRKLRTGNELREKIELSTDLGLHTELDEVEELSSIRVSRALLTHTEARPLRELAVLLCAGIVLHFPRPRISPQEVESFQQAVLTIVRDYHPGLWDQLERLEALDEAAAAGVARQLGEAILEHRFDFRLTQPDLAL
eukprot:TRINITY_DN17347_c0_g2_i5.p2 TRINITY_DN17347_c0_g2~~TRINITY_DN17347_c0_g2_i5.p2  ORF type:complete len:174 (+),score=29.29 TRINITY_DN17347_c0_g2_i5:243-764(+)